MAQALHVVAPVVKPVVAPVVRLIVGINALAHHRFGVVRALAHAVAIHLIGVDEFAGAAFAAALRNVQPFARQAIAIHPVEIQRRLACHPFARLLGARALARLAIAVHALGEHALAAAQLALLLFAIDLRPRGALAFHPLAFKADTLGGVRFRTLVAACLVLAPVLIVCHRILARCFVRTKAV
ncbi:MAG TPA: hypothetical protein VM528_09560 [Burkholderiaceae bacterium]|nr:hypothetical protein [Burkholderiaceae bacterium]